MYQFKDNKSGVYYHEQKFTLQWNFPEASLVVVRYVNGNKRVVLPIVTNSKVQTVDGSESRIWNFILTRLKVLKSGNTITWTEFNNKINKKAKVENYSQESLPAHFGFKRIFLFKASDEFSNIANFRSSHIKLFVIGSKFPWLKIVNVPMPVTLLRIEESNLNVHVEELQLAKPTMNSRIANFEVNRSDVSIENSNFKVVIPNMNTQSDVGFICPSLNQSINQLIASGMISEETNNESILQLIK
jgi:hypothetical protein